ncbi:alpha/beta fold hydrolase [Actinospica robiniae]|uniref:Putative hydrolase or acyltransferase of alpha/beta superfamily n=1 Tax=Actinospica robiniae DSM 44927 TaxID=479430 RepID=W9DYW2_9ACTN|nr:alpha/beta hydrolase [Actinospica robiniae]ETA71013.1 putative hydrolase or acyltransferase of alpha/beta superfamily [Actinospica robiniae DSM 44927]
MSDTQGDRLATGGWHRRAVEVGGLTFDLAEQGPADGRPVLLLHGFPQTHRAYDALAAVLAADGANLRLIALDQRGYSPGARPADPGAYTLPELAGDAAGILEALHLSAVDVVGHDWGSLVGWFLAAHYPDRVRTFTAVSVPHPAAFAAALAASAQQRRMSSYVSLFRDPAKAARVLLEDDARRLRALYRPLDDRAAAPHLAALSDPVALTAALSWYQATKFGEGAHTPTVDVPVTYVWSTADAAISRDAAERCVEHVAGPYRFVELEGISHWIPDEAPEALAAALPFPA